jgi:hypothetical protein
MATVPRILMIVTLLYLAGTWTAVMLVEARYSGVKGWKTRRGHAMIWGTVLWMVVLLWWGGFWG